MNIHGQLFHFGGRDIPSEVDSQGIHDVESSVTGHPQMALLGWVTVIL